MCAMKDKNKQQAGLARWAKHPWEPPASRNVLEEMYVGKMMTQAEIAAELGVSQKRIHTAMKKLKIPQRNTAKRRQVGVLNHMWKGKGAGYQAKHLRIQTLRGRPKKCEVCGTDNPKKMYDWANLTGNYDNPKDYARMCRSCHIKYDNARRTIQRP